MNSEFQFLKVHRGNAVIHGKSINIDDLYSLDPDPSKILLAPSTTAPGTKNWLPMPLHAYLHV